MPKHEVAVIRIPDNLSNKMLALVGVACQVSTAPVEVFNESRVEFLAQLSRRLLADPACKALPEVVTFAYWCRQSNLKRMRDSYTMDERLRMGLGLTFHICPANVPVNFAFSMAFGLLSGNTCVLRLPSKASATIDLLVRVIQSLLEEPDHKLMREALVLLRFARDDELSKFWMSVADGRIVWGGDETVDHMRTFPSKPRSREVAFSDRYSLCAIEPVSVLQMAEPAFGKFAKDLYNDIYLMDQAACSSPQLIAWIGAWDDVNRAQARLWPEVVKISKQNYKLQAIHVIDKFVEACRSALHHNNVQYIQRHENILYRLNLSALGKSQDNCRGSFGMVHEVVLPSLDAMVSIINERYQTLTIQGIEKAVVREWIIRHRLCGIDRVVPIGSALDMNVVWDGYDIVSSLSRIIEI